MKTQELKTERNDQDEPLTWPLKVAIEKLGLGRDLGYRMAYAGKFPGCFKIGGKYLVSVKAINDLLAGKQGG